MSKKYITTENLSVFKEEIDASIENSIENAKEEILGNVQPATELEVRRLARETMWVSNGLLNGYVIVQQSNYETDRIYKHEAFQLTIVPNDHYTYPQYITIRDGDGLEERFYVNKNTGVVYVNDYVTVNMCGSYIYIEGECTTA